MNNMTRYHEEDLKIFRNKGIEYYTFVLTSWMSDRAANNEPVTLVELFTVVGHAEERNQNCYVRLHGHYILIPLDKLRDSANAATLVSQDLEWRLINLKWGQFCSNGFDRMGFNREGRSIIPFATRHTLEVKAKALEDSKKALEKAFQASL
jgi:hypothetical protein